MTAESSTQSLNALIDLMDLSNKPNILKTDYELDLENRNKVDDFKNNYRETFKEEFRSKIPRHPYKLYMELRKEEGLYGGYSPNWNHHKLRALEELKNEFTDKWEDLANDS